MNRENKRKQYDKHYYRHNPCNESFTCKCCGRLCVPAVACACLRAPGATTATIVPTV